jgi:hypothetical protein
MKWKRGEEQIMFCKYKEWPTMSLVLKGDDYDQIPLHFALHIQPGSICCPDLICCDPFFSVVNRGINLYFLYLGLTGCIHYHYLLRISQVGNEVWMRSNLLIRVSRGQRSYLPIRKRQ